MREAEPVSDADGNDRTHDLRRAKGFGATSVYEEAMEGLTNVEKDALEELLRMQVQRASETLGVVTSAPLMFAFARYRNANEPSLAVSAWEVRQRVSGGLDGLAYWWVAQDEGRALIRRLRHAPAADHRLTPMERDGLLEVGHTFIDHMLDGLTAALGLRLAASAPSIHAETSGGHPAGTGFDLSYEVSLSEEGTPGPTSRLGFTVSADTTPRFERALALYVCPFLAELSAFSA